MQTFTSAITVAYDNRRWWPVAAITLLIIAATSADAATGRATARGVHETTDSRRGSGLCTSGSGV